MKTKSLATATPNLNLSIKKITISLLLTGSVMCCLIQKSEANIIHDAEHWVKGAANTVVHGLKGAVGKLHLDDVGDHLNAIGNTLSHELHNATHAVEDVYHKTADGVMTGIHSVDSAAHSFADHVEDAYQQTAHGVMIGVHAVQDFGENTFDQVIKFPKLMEHIGKDIVAVPGMLEDLDKKTGGILGMVVQNFVGQYWSYFQVARYVTEGIITHDNSDFQKAARAAVDPYVQRVRTARALAEGVAHGDPQAIETVAFMAFNSTMGKKLGKMLGQKILATLPKMEKYTGQLNKLRHYAEKLKDVKEITEDVIKGNYEDAADNVLSHSKTGRKILAEKEEAKKLYEKGKTAYSVVDDVSKGHYESAARTTLSQSKKGREVLGKVDTALDAYHTAKDTLDMAKSFKEDPQGTAAALIAQGA